MEKSPKPFPIGIKITTKERLEKLRHSGQSWDGIISELLDKLEIYEAKFNERNSDKFRR